MVRSHVGEGGQHAAGARCGLLPHRSQAHAAPPPLDEADAERLLHLADLHGEGRLGDSAFLRRTAEMAVAGEGIEVAELTGGEHMIRLPYRKLNAI